MARPAQVLPFKARISSDGGFIHRLLIGFFVPSGLLASLFVGAATVARGARLLMTMDAPQGLLPELDNVVFLRPGRRRVGRN